MEIASMSVMGVSFSVRWALWQTRPKSISGVMPASLSCLRLWASSRLDSFLLFASTMSGWCR